MINVTDPVGRDTLDEADHALLELFADRVVMALEALSRFKERSREFEDVRSTFKSILDAKRYINARNADALSLVLRDVAETLGMSPEENATLRYVFNVYDLGLAKVGHNIINQPRELSHEDRFSVEQHTIVGMDMLRPIEFIPRVRDAVLYHHENYDGSGYPGKLSGDEIPIGRAHHPGGGYVPGAGFAPAVSEAIQRERSRRGAPTPRGHALRSESGRSVRGSGATAHGEFPRASTHPSKGRRNSIHRVR